MAAVRAKKADKQVEAEAKQKSKKLSKIVALKPRVSEKSYALAETGNTYIFDVTKDANKHDIARSVSNQYEVEVISVRVGNAPGKPKRSMRRRGRNVYKTSRSDIRKAYVTLQEGDKLPIFSAVEEAGAPEETK
jgi:large subunit ribosomal protein L23